jgi:hypothetical protein
LFDQDIIKSTLGKIAYLPRALPDKRDPQYTQKYQEFQERYVKNDDYGRKIYVKEVELTLPNGSRKIIGRSENYEPKDAELKSAQTALDTLEGMGYKLTTPAIWKKVFC